MLTPDDISKYQSSSIQRALTCASCGCELHPLEVHCCEQCCVAMDESAWTHEGIDALEFAIKTIREDEDGTEER